jgi:hypothetical protein
MVSVGFSVYSRLAIEFGLFSLEVQDIVSVCCLIPVAQVQLFWFCREVQVLYSEGWSSGFTCKFSYQCGRFALHEQVFDQQTPSIVRTLDDEIHCLCFTLLLYTDCYFGFLILAIHVAGTRLLCCFITKKRW